MEGKCKMRGNAVKRFFNKAKNFLLWRGVHDIVSMLLKHTIQPRPHTAHSWYTTTEIFGNCDLKQRKASNSKFQNYAYFSSSTKPSQFSKTKMCGS